MKLEQILLCTNAHNTQLMIQFQSNHHTMNTHPPSSSKMLVLYTIFGTVVLLLFAVVDGLAEDDLNRDSYIDAYHDSRITEIKSKQNQNQNDRESKYSPYYDQTSGPDHHYGPLAGGYPEPPTGGYPEPHYPPPSHYGPPPAYGQSNQGSSFPMPFYGMPHAMVGLLDKFHLKLNIFTVLKLLLKLVIFKKIVGFIALICLLLFIPKFKMNKEDEAEEAEDDRSFTNAKTQVDARLNTLTQYVLSAIDKYSANNNVTCEGINCEKERIYRDIDNKYSYDRLLPMYVAEES